MRGCRSIVLSQLFTASSTTRTVPEHEVSEFEVLHCYLVQAGTIYHSTLKTPFINIELHRIAVSDLRHVTIRCSSQVIKRTTRNKLCYLVQVKSVSK